jgi:Phosphoesterase family
MSDDLKAEIARLRAENEALKRPQRGKLSMKISEKGALSVYGMGRFPVTLYKEQWLKVLSIADEIKAFIEANADRLKSKEPGWPGPGWVPKNLDSGHPGYSVLASYENLVREIVRRVQEQPRLWSHTAIIATTDEGGGHFDNSDHASILKFIERNWHLVPLSGCQPGLRWLRALRTARTDLQSETQYCGYFKTPTLRNAARRRRFFHNARFDSLRQVLRFYAERDTQPQQWYPTVPGRVLKFDDLPARFRDRVDLSDRPFGKGQGTPPALSAAEIEDVLAFLETLDDSD